MRPHSGAEVSAWEPGTRTKAPAGLTRPGGPSTLHTPPRGTCCWAVGPGPRSESLCPTEGPLSVSAWKRNCLLMKCQLRQLAGPSLSRFHRASPHPGSPETRRGAAGFEGLQEPQVFPPALLLPWGAACPSPCVPHQKGVGVGRWRKMWTSGTGRLHPPPEAVNSRGPRFAPGTRSQEKILRAKLPLLRAGAVPDHRSCLGPCRQVMLCSEPCPRRTHMSQLRWP